MNKEIFALALFNAGAIQFGEFELKMHEQHPEAPHSPIYLNLRIPPKGKLTDELVAEIGNQLFSFVFSGSRNLKFKRIVGLPKAGDPLAEAFINASHTVLPWKYLLNLQKEETEGKRRILSEIKSDYQSGQIVLIIDDLITGADTKIEGVEALRANKLVVNDCVVLVDREQGGAKQLAEYGVQLHALYTMTELLNIYVENSCITKEMQQKVAGYQKEVEEYLETNS